MGGGGASLVRIGEKFSYRLQRNSNFAHIFACNFFVSNSSEISVKLWVVLISILKFLAEKGFRSYWHFFETLKPSSHVMAHEKRVSQKCL